MVRTMFRRSSFPAFVLIGVLTACSSAPSDRELENAFQRDRQGLEELRAMMDSDSAIRAIRTDWLGPMKGGTEYPGERGGTIDSQRWDQYRKLFRQLGLRGGISRATEGPCEFYFGSYGSGLAISGTSKGYAYCAGVPSPIVQHLDGGEVSAKTLTYRALHDNWYLYYEID